MKAKQALGGALGIKCDVLLPTTLKGLNLVLLKPLGTLIATAASYLKHYYTQMTSQTLLEFYTYYEHRSDTF